MSEHPPEPPGVLLARITERRKRAGGDGLETLPDDALGVIAWVIAHTDVPTAVLHEDVLDCLKLDHWLQVTLPRRRLTLYHLARSTKAEVKWREIAEAQHLESPQAAQRALERLEAAKEGRKRDEKAVASRRRAELTVEAWIEENATRIREAVEMLAEILAKRSPGDAAELREELDEGSTRTIIAWATHVLHHHPRGICPPAEELAAEYDRRAPAD